VHAALARKAALNLALHTGPSVGRQTVVYHSAIDIGRSRIQPVGFDAGLNTAFTSGTERHVDQNGMH
jgi:hypothetical protein